MARGKEDRDTEGKGVEDRIGKILKQPVQKPEPLERWKSGEPEPERSLRSLEVEEETEDSWGRQGGQH